MSRIPAWESQDTCFFYQRMLSRYEAWFEIFQEGSFPSAVFPFLYFFAIAPGYTSGHCTNCTEKAMEKILPKKVYDLNHMLCLDLFLATANAQTLAQMAPYLKANPGGRHPLLSADVIQFATERTRCVQAKQSDLQTLSALRQEHSWQIDLDALLQPSYDALVLTTPDRIIRWANAGFEAMTGYSPGYMTGKTALLLQGEQTNPQVRKKISRQLQAAVPFTETIVNYRRNQEAYDCEIQIIPLFNAERLLTHFLALETEIKWISSAKNQTIPHGNYI